MTEKDLNRLKSLRAGNRGAVTKILRKLDDAIEETSVDTQEVTNLLNTIEKKKVTLADLDEQLLSNVDSDGIEEEIIETDEYYIDLDRKLRKYKTYLKPSLTATYTSSSALRSTAPEFTPFTYQPQELSQSSSTSSQNHRLPKLSLPHFNGEILDWQYFWDSYESTVHLNHTLTDVQKFSYLKSLLQFDAANVISGLTMTNANYHKAIELLTKRYGQPHKITNAYMRSLLDLDAPMDTLESLRSFHDKSEAYIRGLESLGQSSEMFGSLLIPVILGKLPPEFRKTITRENGNDNWNIHALREAISKEISIQESGYTDYTPKFTGATPSANFVTGIRRENVGTGKNVNRTHKQSSKPQASTKKKQCTFCDGNHWPNECEEIVDIDKRIAIVKNKNLCYNCFGPHRVADCKSKYTCKSCHRKHHSSICKKNTRSNSTSSSDNISRKNKQENETSMFYTASEERSTVLLKTAVNPVVYANTSMDVNILFDEGAQRSFITEDLARKLDAKVEGTESLSITTFGSDTKKVRNLDKSTICLKSTDGELIPIKVLIVPTIASPLQNHNLNLTQRFKYLRGLQLAHPVMDGE